jgi:hypothetical protein
MLVPLGQRGATDLRRSLLSRWIAKLPAETRKLMSTEIAKWRAVIDRAGIERQ